jgi:queuosine precursor transporter
MNELIFIIHTLVIAGFALGSLALGPTALVAFVCIQCMLANLFVIKQITLFGLTATCADAFTVGATIGLNLLQEYFGKDIAKRTIWINFFLLVFYTIASQVHLSYIPHSADIAQQYFMPLLILMPRIVIASFSVYLFTQMTDYYLYGILKKTFQDKYIVFRNYISIAFCQLLDTILFSFLGLYGIIDNIGEVIVISYLIKLASIIVATPFVAFSRTIYAKTRSSYSTNCIKN